MQALYTASATATGGRAGQVRSSDGALDLSLAWPKEIGGAGGAGTNPEQLFAAGYAACFAQALVRAARDRSPYWLYHPVASFLQAATYADALLRDPMGRRFLISTVLGRGG